MVISFFESNSIANLYPLTLTRPAADLRCGILTIAEKWAKDLQAEGFGFETNDVLQPDAKVENRTYLSEKFPSPSGEVHRYINGHLLPTPALIAVVNKLQAAQSLWKDGQLIAAGNTSWNANRHYHQAIEKSTWTGEHLEWSEEIRSIDRPYHIFAFNGDEIKADFHRLTEGKTSQPLGDSNQQFGPHPVFIEEGAVIHCATLNTTGGPIYIGKNAEIMEGSLVRGPFALCEGAVLKMASKVYSNTTLGPFSVAGGEISNVVFWGYSNKGHDGFLGNAVLGEWCNLGADTNASNLKNTYEDVKVWNYRTGRFDKSGMQFCGLIMGDHSKCGINTMFNTGTVVGVACNIFGAGFPRNFVADFSWGGAQGMVTHQLAAVDKTAALVMPRRKREYSDVEKNIIHHVFKIWSIKE